MSPSRQLGLLWGGVAAAIMALSPLAATVAARLWVCPFRAAVTIPCPSCGTTRAALALIQFDLVAALALNPLATLAIVGLIGGGLIAGLAALLGHGVPALKVPLPAAIRLTAIAVLIANWVYVIWAGV